MFSELCHRYSRSAEAYVFVVVSYHVGDRREILPYELSEDAVTFAMEDAHLLHIYEDGVVDEISDGVEGLVASHAPHVKVVTEVALPLSNGVERLP